MFRENDAKTMRKLCEHYAKAMQQLCENYAKTKLATIQKLYEN